MSPDNFLMPMPDMNPHGWAVPSFSPSTNTGRGTAEDRHTPSPPGAPGWPLLSQVGDGRGRPGREMEAEVGSPQL